MEPIQFTLTFYSSESEINSEVLAVTLDGWKQASNFKISLSFSVFNVSTLLSLA